MSEKNDFISNRRRVFFEEGAKTEEHICNLIPPDCSTPPDEANVRFVFVLKEGTTKTAVEQRVNIMAGRYTMGTKRLCVAGGIKIAVFLTDNLLRKRMLRTETYADVA
jgi:hypothetical protein